MTYRRSPTERAAAGALESLRALGRRHGVRVELFEGLPDIEPWIGWSYAAVLVRRTADAQGVRLFFFDEAPLPSTR